VTESGAELGMLDRLKLKLSGVTLMKNQETYSELDHRYAIMKAKSDIVRRFL